MLGRKNKTKTNPLKKGDAVRTRDEHLEENNGYKKQSHINDDELYRQMFALEVAPDGTFIGVKVQSGGKSSVINKSKQVEKYNPIMKTKDNEGKFIRLGKKFRRDKKKYGISEEDADKIVEEMLNNPNKSIRNKNRNKYFDFKNNK